MSYYRNLLERFSTWAKASRLGFECKIFFGVDDLKVHLIVSRSTWTKGARRCHHEFDWEKQGQWLCKLCHTMIAVIYREKHGDVILTHQSNEELIRPS